jgi:hypothetical protein
VSISLGGGGSSAIRKEANTNTRAATGQSNAEGGSQSISGLQLQDSASVVLTDHGAVGRAFDALKATTDAAFAQARGATVATSEAYKSAQAQAGAVNADQLMRYGLVAVVLVVGLLAWKGRQ